MAYVTNKTLVDSYKKKYGAKWFDEFSHNTIVLEREKDVFLYYDMEKESEDIFYWVNKQSLKKNGDELNRETQVINTLLEETQAVLFIDRKDPNF